MDNKERIRQIAEEKAGVIGQMNRDVWSYAESGYKEFKSAAKLEEVLREEGFQVEAGIADIETAFVGTYGNGGPVIGIMGEYDALPNLSQQAGVAKRCPIEGQSYGHGCGHSALGAGAVGAALIVKKFLEDTGMPGTIKVFGCPAEEAGFGKGFMAKAGCFDGLDMAFSWHPMDMNMCFPRSVANYKVRFDFKGKTSHAGASPELGRSALDACELMNVGVNYLREHVVSDARIHYAYLDCGGDAPNIVQGHASVLYFVRAPRLSMSAEILERIKKIAQGAALMTETEVSVKVLGGLSDFIPNPTASTLLSDAFIAQGGPDFGEEEYAIAREFLAAMPEEQREKSLAAGAKMNGLTKEEFAKRPLNTTVIPYTEKVRESLSTGSTDVGDVSYLVPTGQYTAAVGIPGTGPHTWQFAAQVGTSIGDKASVAIARAMAYACTFVYEKPELAGQAKKELLEETGGVYNCPIPDDVKPGEGM
ncbi:aminobenzoyl-glutamate utilization protein B [Lachnoclostridium sp. An14]|uniref:amidohydrolase n=1 Tax=Lachnoclostridium sp. An14 TaxID=1965562 RepID=UPI000B37354D|nr:amidohydrolase [Lachnoclostridium sp. An14]OUQ15487.1 aminobenzoyl-glutamate utilization protein B [Lachnoclostridium sp. An14]